MCGIFGIVISKEGQHNKKLIKSLVEDLAVLSESRGKESCGFAMRSTTKGSIHVLKAAEPSSALVKDKLFKDFFAPLKNKVGNLVVIGHSRLVTNGSHIKSDNNQPFVKDGVVGIHNGIIVNDGDIWKNNPDLERTSEVDTESMLALMARSNKQGNSLSKGLKSVYETAYGTISTAQLFNDIPGFLLSTNNGSIYYIYNKPKGIFLFASEAFIVDKLAQKLKYEDLFKKCSTKHLKPWMLLEFQLEQGEMRKVDLMNGAAEDFKVGFDKIDPFEIKVEVKAVSKHLRNSVVDLDLIRSNPKMAQEEAMMEYQIESIKKLKRCTKCLLPETFPFIRFDDQGVCMICNNYKQKNQPRPFSDLEKLVDPYRKPKGQPDCIIPFSGGRDSTFMLHVVKKELGLNPIAYTYDWGMVTDLARRNIARSCGKLGVENIIVSADIRMKRENIKKNISAWLKRPELGMVPLFMAGDKYFFYYCDQLKKQTGIDLNIWGVNNLENTDFKTGFCGIAPNFDKKHIYSLTKMDQMKLFGFVGKNFLLNPAYLNSSLKDTFGSFVARYGSPRKDYYHFFDYYQWEENAIENLLKDEYDWEMAEDTRSSWRIGDGTASFYNYVYTTVAGFSEFDTFRSNQIREGMMTREEGLELIYDENRPRYESFKWYLETIGLDFEHAVKVINKIPKLYPTDS
ncbi:MAG: glucosamine--fructose-6-phosphate aminotransferase (isomerizing) [Bacteroidia bacterium]|jgi:glucosamine--fructose-6-phosphate aminotransferase (isomerizing)